MRLNDATPDMWNKATKKTAPERWKEAWEEAAYEENAKAWLKAAYEENSKAWEEEAVEDVVNNPDHYNTGNIECIDAIEESMSSVAFKGYLKGNCIKYLWRYDYKGKQVEDLEKAGWYLNKLTDMVAEENS